jgi:hypothetical protein
VYEVHEWSKVRELYREGASRKAIARARPSVSGLLHALASITASL